MRENDKSIYGKLILFDVVTRGFFSMNSQVLNVTCFI